MTVTNPDLSPTESAQLRPLLVSVYAHVILGYSLYVVALLQTSPPLWALNYIEQLKPTLGALETAARLSEHPFPAQVMILYAILSSVLLGMYWVSYMFLVKHIRQEMYRRMCEQWQQTGISAKERLGFFGFGLAVLYVFGYELPIHSFVEGGVLVQGAPHRLAGSSTVLLVDPVDHLVVARVVVDGSRVYRLSFGLISINRSFSTPRINKELTMSTTVEIALGIIPEVVKGPLVSAQAATLAAYKAAGSDLAALATKAGTSIAFLGEKRWGRCLTLYLAIPIAA